MPAVVPVGRRIDLVAHTRQRRLLAMTDNPHLLVLGGIREVHDALLSKGCRLTWFVDKTKTMAKDQDRTCRHIVMFDPDTRIEALQEIASAIHREDRFDRVCAFHDDSQLPACAIARHLRLPAPYDSETIWQTRDKYRMRLKLKRAGLCSVKSAIVDHLRQLEDFVRSNPTIGSLILKPVSGTGSRDVVRLDASDVSALAGGDTEPQLAFPLLAEQFIEGVEYSVEAFTHAGYHHIVCITEKFKDSSSFIESGHLVPARISDELAQSISSYVRRCLSALNVTCGPSHTEVIVNKSGVFIVETHTRVAGDSIPHLAKLATGVDLYALTACQSMGDGLDVADLPPQQPLGHAAIKFMIQDASVAPVISVDGVDEIRRWPQVKDVHIYHGPGQALPPVKHSFDRAASVLVVGETADDALTMASDALSRIRYTFA